MGKGVLKVGFNDEMLRCQVTNISSYLQCSSFLKYTKNDKLNVIVDVVITIQR